jgi:hypothetical protein
MAITHRIVQVPKQSFEEWLKAREIDQADVLLGDAYSNAVAELLLGRGGFATRKTSGQARTLGQKMRYTQALQKEYQENVEFEERQVPLDLNKESDQAYVRVMEKRLRRSTCG